MKKYLSDKIYILIITAEALVVSLLLTFIKFGVSAPDLKNLLSQTNFQSPKLFIIRSGSMGNSMPQGSLVLSQPKADYRVNEVISFYRDQQIITHRIIDINNSSDTIQYQTQGDANPGPDRTLAPKDQVIGSVLFIMPRLGRAAAYLKTKQGRNLLIFLPAIFIILTELLNIFKEFKFLKNKKTAFALSIIFIYPLLNIKSSNAVFTDTESVNVTISTKTQNQHHGDWDKSSLSFDEEYKCEVQENEISVWICNNGDENMQGISEWEVYWLDKGNPKNGQPKLTSVLDALHSGECELLTFDTEAIAGNYKFKAFQRPGHPGTGELWSESCTIDK